MLVCLKDEVRRLFYKKGACDAILFWQCQEKYRPGKNDLVMAFPWWEKRDFFVGYVRSVIEQASRNLGLSLSECSLSGTGGLVRFVGREQEVVNIIINCAQGRKRTFLLLRMFQGKT